MAKYDEIWKEILENLFEKFVFFYLPDLAVDIDFSKGYTFLDKEFQAIEIKSEDNTRFLDKLIQIYLKNGEEQWILLHIDVQFAKETDFAERMFKYFYRTYDKYNKKIVACVVFTGTSKSYQKRFDYKYYKTKLVYEYRSAQLTNYKEKYLMSQDNPFALVTLAVKYGLKSRNDEELRFKFKRKLIKLMFERGFNEDDIINMFRFIEIMLELEDEKLNNLIYNEIRSYTKGVSSVVITKFEERAMEKEKIEIARKSLKIGLSIEQIAQITGLPVEKIKEIEKDSE